ncbi:MAG: YebC/PmpR family DNA-binding transcriptional regulator [Clostridiales bacterium]|jgi:YebC/PmpR family DNA-binding regulatory protein|nr:YebC/PmpR family DNA-binding transcriptional regulator [Clostridiales bacterium]
MSGHSKWATIKRAKGKTDAARGKAFTKIGREIAVAVKQGGGNPALNSKLRDIIAKAKALNIPNDNISRSIKKAGGEVNSINYDTVIYEGYGPGGIAVIVETLTDNKNRTAADVRHIFDKFGGAMGTNGCVSYLFKTKGVMIVEKTAGSDDDALMLLALECGAEDFSVSDGAYEITCKPEDFSAVREALEQKGITFLQNGIEKIPLDTVDVADPEKFLKMLNMFDDNDDVQEVAHNALLPETDGEE